MKFSIFFILFALHANFLLAAVQDSDGDGIPDTEDLCSNTPKGANVWKEGPFKGCSAGQIRDADLEARRRADTFQQSTSCEQTLIGYLQRLSANLQAHRYEGENCRWKVNSINDSTQSYVDLGNEQGARFGFIYINTLPMPELQRRLQVCLGSMRTIAAGLDELDQMDCRCDVDGWSERQTRVPSAQPASPTSIALFSSGPSTVTGNTTTYANGVYYSRNGNITTGSDGSMYTHMGNITIGSNGVTYVTTGNVTTGSNGKTYIRTGSFINSY